MPMFDTVFPENIVPFAHQRKWAEICRDRLKFGHFWKPGTGKTFASLAVHRMRPCKTLVLAPKRVVTTAWEQACDAMGVPFINAVGPARRRKAAMAAGDCNTVIGLNYEQLIRFTPVELARFGFHRVFADEASCFRNRDTKTAKLMFRLAEMVPEMYPMTGTPSPNDREMDVWSLLHVMGPKAGGPSFTRFAKYFCTPVYKTVPAPPRFRVVGARRVNTNAGKTISALDRWAFKPGAQRQFNEHLARWSWGLRKEDAMDLPTLTEVVVPVDMSTAEKKMYKETQELLQSESTTVSSFAALQGNPSFMRLRQIPGGTAIDPQRGPVRIGSSKVDALAKLLDEIGSMPVVIWAEFRGEIDYIRSVIKARGESVSVVDGRTRDGDGEIQRFMRGDTTRFICHPQAMGHGVDGLQKVCSYAIYYSKGYSAEYFEQSRDRIHRGGQNHRVTIYHLVSCDTIDEPCHKIVKNKLRSQDILMSHIGRAA